MVIEKPTRLLTTLYLSTLATMVLVCSTKLGFPYSGEKGNLAPHRAFVLHTEREYYDKVCVYLVTYLPARYPKSS